MMVAPPTSTFLIMSSYYSEASFAAMAPVAVVYSMIANLAATFLRPIGLFPRPRSLAPLFQQQQAQKNNKLAIVTGSNTGIGFETAKTLVDHGWNVILACRSESKALKAVDAINSSNPPGKALFAGCLDLSSFDSVREFSNNIKKSYKQVDVLINNAGRNTSGPSPDDNLDLCFQANFLGHFLLTHELLDLLENGGKVINLSSVMHHFAGTNGPQDVDYWKRVASYGVAPDSTYSPSKLAALLFTLELNERYSTRGIRSMAVNPGAVNSDIWRDFPRWIIPFFRILYLDLQQGCCTTVAAAVGDFDNNQVYLQPYWLPSWMQTTPFPILEMMGPFAGYRVTEPRLPNDGGIAQSSLWKASEELTGCTFPLMS